MSETAEVHELGTGFLASIDAPDEPARQMMQFQIDKFRKMLNGLKDIHYVEEFHPVEGSRVDRLSRFKSYGIRGRIASPTYDLLKEHFKCHERHIPRQLTKEFIWELIEELHQQEEEERQNELDED